jgi:alkanesulfonate monooxygenase SsuD/methylene tetrahydromethanopterin reductase-like flavin-dependent oxidoreductase (luciferase family)
MRDQRGGKGRRRLISRCVLMAKLREPADRSKATRNAGITVIADARFHWSFDVSLSPCAADRLAGVRVSFQLLPEQPMPELLDAIAAADRLGYYGCYSADEIYHKDAWLLFAAAAQRTERIRLGPCVAPIYMREPTFVAQLAATLDELSDGRAEVVFGIGNIAMLEQYGVEWRGTRPIARLREAHQVMRAVLDKGAIDFEGDFYRYTGVTTASRPVQEHLPLKIGTMGGPKSMELAGEIADGLHTACAYSPEALCYAVEHFQAGVDRAGRNPDGLDLGDSLLGAIAPDGDIARRRRANTRRVLHPVDAPGAPRAARYRVGKGRGHQRSICCRRRSARARSDAGGIRQPDHGCWYA